MERRNFLKFLSASVALSIFEQTMSKNKLIKNCRQKLYNIDFKGILPSTEDAVVLSEELDYHIIASWKDAISSKDYFGFNNDFLCFFPSNKNGTEGLLWVNHEYIDRFFLHDKTKENITLKEVDQEIYNVGGSIIKIKQDKKSKKWNLVKDDISNKRITAKTPIPFANNIKIKNTNIAIGTLGNCAGGKTPWNTLLTCEENYDANYGENIYNNNIPTFIESYLGWEKFYNHPTEHYGWVVEIDMQTGEVKKHTSMGRMAHECATTHLTKDGRCVVYTGDDANDECLYKFISDKPNSLDTGKLYVADLENNKWILLDIDADERLKNTFKDNIELLIRTRDAAKIVGATPLDRPEDIEIHPYTKDIYISLTNNIPNGNYHGSILKIKETNHDFTSLTFEHEYFLTGGNETGFACPDNLAFDKKGNLWFTSDISGSKIGKTPYEKFKNNSLFYVPIDGKNKGKVIQIASAPNNAEFTGPWFSEDDETLFLSVQHPGEFSKDNKNLISHWPDGGSSVPKSSVIAIQLK
jgi:secreted PhoX family phosphatase